MQTGHRPQSVPNATWTSELARAAAQGSVPAWGPCLLTIALRHWQGGAVECRGSGTSPAG